MLMKKNKYFIGYIISLIVLQFLMSRFKKSMEKLNDKVKELASGSGDLTKEIDIYTGDELEVILDKGIIYSRVEKVKENQ